MKPTVDGCKQDLHRLSNRILRAHSNKEIGVEEMQTVLKGIENLTATIEGVVNRRNVKIAKPKASD